jgi:hypothetical protein
VQERDARGQFPGYLHGQRVVDLWGGDEVAGDDLQGAQSSAAVGVAAMANRVDFDLVLRLVDTVDDPVGPAAG